MRLFVLISILLFYSNTHAGTFEITFSAEKKTLSRPNTKRKADKKHNIILINNLMKKLHIQLLNQSMELIQNISLEPRKEKSITFRNNSGINFLRPSQPASELIILDSGKTEGEEIEVP